MGKLLHMNAGTKFSLQVHDQKQESWFLISGRATLITEDKGGNLVEVELQPGQGYSITVGQKHRIVSETECEIIEASTPEQGTTWRLEDDYARPDETPEQRKIERGEA
jgi:mannose-6-phosphate isomerase-like protein (cupin superfamily)